MMKNCGAPGLCMGALVENLVYFLTKLSYGASFRYFLVAFLAASTSAQAATSGDYQRAGDGTEVVLRKMYPKRSRVEIEGTGGLILNQSYINTLLFGGGINYFWSEEWGLGVEAMMAANSDKSERTCLENFYNDPDNMIGRECGDGSDLTGRANFGPAYVPIRQTNMLFSGNVIWNPVYGKQIAFFRFVTHFDLYFLAGGGIAMSTVWPQQTNLKGTDRSSRGSFNVDPNAGGNPGAAVGETGLYGTEGRPASESATNPQGTFAVGQKYHFAKNFHARIELRNYLLLGTKDGFDNFFALTGGVGVRF
jgi:outer membrane beta-barrel protein